MRILELEEFLILMQMCLAADEIPISRILDNQYHHLHDMPVKITTVSGRCLKHVLQFLWAEAFCGGRKIACVLTFFLLTEMALVFISKTTVTYCPFCYSFL